jgi:23S rRNA (uracil1939-C5)-methyltransferase
VAELILDIDSLNSSGDGVARHGRRTVTVPFTIPGERVRVTVEGSRDGLSASLLEVVRASPHRIVPRCPHFGPCGGCSWQHIAYPHQLRLKTDLVSRLVQEAVPHAPRVRPMLAATALDDPWGYRAKVHFVFGTSGRTGRRGGAPVMGHYARGSRHVVPVYECPVHAERGNEVAFNLFDVYSTIGAQAGAAATLKSIAVRVSSSRQETMATLVVTGDTDKRLRAETRKALSEPWAPSSFHVNMHPKGDAFIFGRETRRIAGPERLREDLADTSFLISPTAFFQTNVKAAALLVRLVLESVPTAGTVLDLYAGAGLFALPLARRGQRVVAVEESAAAVADGEASRALNRIPVDRCRFIAKPLESLARLPVADCTILDPPRDGCRPSVIDAVFGERVPRLAVYVSCNPDTLARDLKRIASHRYAAESIQPVDMFPHTPHIETVVILKKQ